MANQYEIREDPTSKYWSFVVWHVTENREVDRYPTREKAQARIDTLLTPIDLENSPVWQALSKGMERKHNAPPLAPELPNTIELLSRETVGTIIEYKGHKWLVTACYYLTPLDVAEIEDVNDAVVSIGWHSHLRKVVDGEKLLPTLAELVQRGEATFTSPETIWFLDEEAATEMSDLAYSDELGVYKKSRMGEQ